MEKSKKYSKEDFEAMIPDYAFEMLNEEDKKLFEEAAAGHPELMYEANEIKSGFSKISKIDIDSYISSRTRNLSVKVNEKLSYAKPSRLKYYLGISLPAAAALIIAFYTIIPDRSGVATEQAADINTKEALEMALPTEVALSEEESAIDEAYEEYFFEEGAAAPGAEIAPLAELNEINDMTDEEFEELIKALKNEKVL